MSNPLLYAAHQYLNLGLSIIALSGKAPNGKVHPHGLKDALQSSDFGDDIPWVRRAFLHPDTTGIGILTGYPYVVVDIDGEEGAQQWLDIVGYGDHLPDRWVAKTSRGLHLWYSDIEPHGTRKLGPKLDLKGEGGYVAAPPSVHPSGDIYTWLMAPDATLPPLELPLLLQKLLKTQDFEAKRRQIGRDTQKRVQQPPKEGWFVPQWGNEGILAAMKGADEGNRNHLLFWCAATLQEEDAPEEDFDTLRDLALEAGLEPRETRLTIRSGRRKARD